MSHGKSECWRGRKIGSRFSWVTLSLKNLMKIRHFNPRKMHGIFGAIPEDIQAKIKDPSLI